MVAPSHGGTAGALQCVHKQVVAERRADIHSTFQGLVRRIRCPPTRSHAPITCRGKAGRHPLDFPGSGEAHQIPAHT